MRAGLLMADILYLGVAVVGFAVVVVSVMLCERV
jgi:hypothetical protein